MRHFSDVIANGKLILAIHKDIPVGFSGGKKTADGKESAISIIYVTPSYRGNFLGRELLCLLEDYYRDEGCEIMKVVPPLPEVIGGFLGGMGYKETESQLSKQLSTDKIV
jgi:GNAT superfamily N-acetyltransferase